MQKDRAVRRQTGSRRPREEPALFAVAVLRRVRGGQRHQHRHCVRVLLYTPGHAAGPAYTLPGGSGTHLAGVLVLASATCAGWHAQIHNGADTSPPEVQAEPEENELAPALTTSAFHSTSSGTLLAFGTARRGGGDYDWNDVGLPLLPSVCPTSFQTAARKQRLVIPPPTCSRPLQPTFMLVVFGPFLGLLSPKPPQNHFFSKLTTSIPGINADMCSLDPIPKNYPPHQKDTVN